MGLNTDQKTRIKRLLIDMIDGKLKKYERETTFMPFLARLVQDSEKIAAYSFMHSLATSLGMSVYEDVSLIVAAEKASRVSKNYEVGGLISPAQREVINRIIAELRNGTRIANIEEEKRLVLEASSANGTHQKSGNLADLYMYRGKDEHFFEIKTAKPNIDVFEKSKKKLLEWVARKRRSVKVYLAFPYNPYHPNPYTRFTQVGMMDPPNDFVVGEQYWDFLGGENTFVELLNTFDEVGKEYSTKLSNKFRKIAEEDSYSY